MIYTIRQMHTLKDLQKYKSFFMRIGQELTNDDTYPEFKNFSKMNLPNYAETGRFMMSFYGEEPVGLMLSRLSRSIFDRDIVILKQDLLYAKPNTRAAHCLFHDFLDFGKNHADHIITMIAERTNVKRQSLERLGFKKMEELYRIEV